ncbi:hypothetical protein [Undibacterium sp. Ren11W]|uniref:hypothetical protein n=1 Tax=Undibacterium sp. Ren11W TaxID=3413045 RepID=UPI003BEFE50A
MKTLLTALLLTASCHVLAECKPFKGLEGVVSLEPCRAGDTCVPATEAFYQYLTKKTEESDDPTVLNFSAHASPWHLYDSEMRILNIEDVAEMMKPYIQGGVKRIVLKASWSAVSPDRGEKSLTRKLSEALGGFPVEGADGFLWISKDGSIRTTHQATTFFQGGGPYQIKSGSEVFASMLVGWQASLEDVFLRDKNANGINAAGAAWDIFYLCPERALQAFETAARYDNPIAAYNAAMIRLERKSKSDLTAATALLSQAAKAGDQKAQTRLAMLSKPAR